MKIHRLETVLHEAHVLVVADEETGREDVQVVDVIDVPSKVGGNEC